MKSLPSQTLPISVMRSEPAFRLSYEAIYGVSTKNLYGILISLVAESCYILTKSQKKDLMDYGE
jgi:hypothetical protein